MKLIKKIFLLLLIMIPFTIVNTIYAELDKTSAVSNSTQKNTSGNGGGSNSIKVNVTEYVPGAGCVCKKKADKGTGCLQYTCTIQPGMTTVQMILGQIIKWLTAIAALAGVLFIVVNGILLSMHGGEKEKIKTRITTTITGLILLLLSGVILSVIAPWVYK